METSDGAARYGDSFVKIVREIDTRDISRFMKGFFGIVPRQQWIKRIASFQEQVRSNPFLGEYFAEDYQIELGVAALLEHEAQSGSFPDVITNPLMPDALTFICSFVQVYHHSTDSARSKLTGMLKSAIKNAGCTSLAFELQTATHLSSVGFDVVFSDLESCGDSDLIATRGSAQLDVECKCISPDKGMPITRKSLPVLANLLRDKLFQLATEWNSDFLVYVKFLGPLTTSETSVRILANDIICSVGPSNNMGSTATHVEIKRVSLANTPFRRNEQGYVNQADCLRFVRENFRVDNPALFSLISPSGKSFVVIVESNKPNAVAESVHRQLLESGNKQFSKTRPGALFVYLPSTSAIALRGLKDNENQKPNKGTAIQKLTTDLLNRRPHLHTVAYLSPCEIEEARHLGPMGIGRVWRSSGATYHFVNPMHPKAYDVSYSLFPSAPGKAP